MASEQTPQKPAEPRSFWATLPGMLTAVGGLIAAAAALITALASAGVLGPKPTATPAVAAAAQTVPPAPPPPSLTAPPAASATAAPAAQPSAGPAAAPAPPAELFSDDFEDPGSGWLAAVTAEAEKGYEAGEYRIRVYETDFASWGYPDRAVELADFVVEVDARRMSGPEDNEYGLLVRYQPEDGFYFFALSSTGQFSVQKYTGEDWLMLVDWTASRVVRGAGDVNRLRVTCQGAKMRFFVNGEPLAQVEDAAFAAGNIGLLASSADQGGVSVAFDNLRVRPFND